MVACEELIRVVARKKDAVAFAIGPFLLDLRATLHELLGDSEKHLFDTTIVFGRHLRDLDHVPGEAKAKGVEIRRNVTTSIAAGRSTRSATAAKAAWLEASRRSSSSDRGWSGGGRARSTSIG